MSSLPYEICSYNLETENINTFDSAFDFIKKLLELLKIIKCHIVSLHDHYENHSVIESILQEIQQTINFSYYKGRRLIYHQEVCNKDIVFEFKDKFTFTLETPILHLDHLRLSKYTINCKSWDSVSVYGKCLDKKSKAYKFCQSSNNPYRIYLKCGCVLEEISPFPEEKFLLFKRDQDYSYYILLNDLNEHLFTHLVKKEIANELQLSCMNESKGVFSVDKEQFLQDIVYASKKLDVEIHKVKVLHDLLCKRKQFFLTVLANQ